VILAYFGVLASRAMARIAGMARHATSGMECYGGWRCRRNHVDRQVYVPYTLKSQESWRSPTLHWDMSRALMTGTGQEPSANSAARQPAWGAALPRPAAPHGAGIMTQIPGLLGVASRPRVSGFDHFIWTTQLSATPPRMV
jgi:hypothetical protein